MYGHSLSGTASVTWKVTINQLTNDVKAPPRYFERGEADLDLKSQQQRFIHINEKYRANIHSLWVI